MSVSLADTQIARGIPSQKNENPASHATSFSGTVKPGPGTGIVAVIPAYNQEQVIGSAVLKTRQQVDRVIVVDAGSVDGTADVAKEAGADVLKVDTADRVQALFAGLRFARELGCNGAVMLDPTRNYYPGEILQVTEHVRSGKADVIIGPGHIDTRIAMMQYLTGNLEAPKTPVSTVRAMSAKALGCMTPNCTGKPFNAEIADYFRRQGLVIYNISMQVNAETSKAAKKEEPLRYRSHSVGVVVPAYNEQLLIGNTLKSIPAFVTRIYVVNDSSRDKTQEIIEEFAKKDPRVVPIRHEKNSGVGAAIVTGYRRALDEKMDLVAVMAGDNQMDPAFLPDLLDPIIDGKCDYTMGNRLISPEFRKGMSKWRFLGNAMLTMLTKIASGYWQMMDPQNGYTAISHRALSQISLDDIYPRYGYCNDILVRLNVYSFRIVNVPHPARYGLEKSKIKYSTYIVRVSKLLLKDFLWRLKMKYIALSFHPLVFFYVFGAALCIMGFFGGAYAFYHKFFQSAEFFMPGLLSLVAFGLGVQCIFFAMFFDMQQEKMGNGWY